MNIESCSISIIETHKQINQSINQSNNHSVLPKDRSFTANWAFSTLPCSQLSFRNFIQSIYHKVVYHLISSAANFLPFTIPSRASFSKQLLLSQWTSQLLFLFSISSSIILPSHTLSSTTAFLFCLSILHAPSFSISASECFQSFFAHSVVESKSLHHTTLHSTEGTSLASSLVLFPRVKGEHIHTNT